MKNIGKAMDILNISIRFVCILSLVILIVVDICIFYLSDQLSEVEQFDSAKTTLFLEKLNNHEIEPTKEELVNVLSLTSTMQIATIRYFRDLKIIFLSMLFLVLIVTALQLLVFMKLRKESA
jgi:Na+-transporting NADH:ubiquinone oxidoreductase subunit NqrC